jgi:hypothetical protein
MQERKMARSYRVVTNQTQKMEQYLNDPSGCRIAAFRKKAAVRHLRN